MEKRFRILMIVALLVVFSACDEESTNEPVDPDVAAPTNVRASSSDEAVILHWDPSSSEGQENFGGYKINVKNEDDNTSTVVNAPRGDGHTVTGLLNGTRYVFTIWAVTTQDKESPTSVAIEWAPAIRRYVNQTGDPIRVYATTSSTFNSAVDLFNASGIAEVIPQAGQEFRDRGDLYVDAPNTTSNFLRIVSPDAANNEGLETQFSTVSYDADDLDEQFATTAPSTATYSKHDISITSAQVSAGKVIYGRLSRNNKYLYFRLLVKRGAAGSMVQGSGADRYLEFDVSYQHVADVPFAKK
ncbi:fibronectin type III domain-containing protein [bacterium]|nr:fibronectin type III domain-containing protein [bacterium]